MTGPALNGTFFPYALFMESLVEGIVNFESDIFYMMLCTSTYIPNQNTHKFKSVVAGELDGTYSGYAAGGLQMPISTISYTGTTKQLAIMPSDLQWPLVTFPNPGARYGVVYDIITKDGSNSPAAMPLIGYIDFIANQVVSDMAFNIQWPTTGMMTIQLP